MPVDTTGGVLEAAKALIPRARRAFQLSGVRDDDLVRALARIAYANVHQLRGPGLAGDAFDALTRLRDVLARMETSARPKWTQHEREKLQPAASSFIERVEKYLKRETLRRLQTRDITDLGAFRKFAAPILRPVRQGFTTIQSGASDLLTPATAAASASPDGSHS